MGSTAHAPHEGAALWAQNNPERAFPIGHGRLLYVERVGAFKRWLAQLEFARANPP
jgi:hypothetical protein